MLNPFSNIDMLKLFFITYSIFSIKRLKPLMITFIKLLTKPLLFANRCWSVLYLENCRSLDIIKWTCWCLCSFVSNVLSLTSSNLLMVLINSDALILALYVYSSTSIRITCRLLKRWKLSLQELGMNLKCQSQIVVLLVYKVERKLLFVHWFMHCLIIWFERSFTYFLSWSDWVCGLLIITIYMSGWTWIDNFNFVLPLFMTILLAIC